MHCLKHRTHLNWIKYHMVLNLSVKHKEDSAVWLLKLSSFAGDDSHVATCRRCVDWIVQECFFGVISTFVFAHEEKLAQNSGGDGRWSNSREGSKHIRISVHWRVSGHVYARVFSARVSVRANQQRFLLILIDCSSVTHTGHTALRL